MRIKNNIKNLFVISSLLFTSTFFVNNLSADENSNSLTSTITSSEKVQTSTISQIEEVVDSNEIDSQLNKTVVNKFGNKEYVKFNLGHLIPLNDFEAEFSVKLGDNLKTKKISAKQSEKISGFIQMPVATGDYLIELKNNDNKKILSIKGTLDQENDKYSHQLVDIDHELKLLVPVKDKDGFSIDLGYAEGSLKAEVVLSKNYKNDCDVNMSLDSNADGIFQNDEKVIRKISQENSYAQGSSLTRLPLTSKYEVSILCDSIIVASNYGSYDFANGEAVDSKKTRDAEIINSFAVGVERIPYITVVKIPGESIFPLKENLEILPEESEESWDFFGSRSEENNEGQEKINEVEVENQIVFNDLFKWFADHPWSYVPASLVLGILIIGFFIAIAIIAQRKNQL